MFDLAVVQLGACKRRPPSKFNDAALDILTVILPPISIDPIDYLQVHKFVHER